MVWRTAHAHLCSKFEPVENDGTGFSHQALRRSNGIVQVPQRGLDEKRIVVQAFGKTRPLKVEDFAAAEKAFGADANGKSKRKDEGEEGRYRCFTRKQIEERNDNLDIAWLRDTEAEAEEGLTEPENIAAAIIGHLKAALGEIEELSDELEGAEEAAVTAPAKEAAE